MSEAMNVRVTGMWPRERRWAIELCPHCKRRVPVYAYYKPGTGTQVLGCSRRCANKYLDSLERPAEAK